MLNDVHFWFLYIPCLILLDSWFICLLCFDSRICGTWSIWMQLITWQPRLQTMTGVGWTKLWRTSTLLHRSHFHGLHVQCSIVSIYRDVAGLRPFYPLLNSFLPKSKWQLSRFSHAVLHRRCKNMQNHAQKCTSPICVEKDKLLLSLCCPAEIDKPW